MIEHTEVRDVKTSSTHIVVKFDLTGNSAKPSKGYKNRGRSREGSLVAQAISLRFDYLNQSSFATPSPP
jgi:hypothetical protein